MMFKLATALLLLGTATAVHLSDNKDGTYSNPVMPNAHWSDPAVLRVGNEYYVVTSSIETSPNLQILKSTDLVNWDVIGSVSRFWYTHTVDGRPIKPEQCWSPRLSYVLGNFRVMWHQNGKFMVAEARNGAGPWHLVKNNLTHMESPWPGTPRSNGPQWAATTYLDNDGKTYLFAANWIQECDAAALNWVGDRHMIDPMGKVGVGLMENPSLMKRGGWYYWHESSNGTVTWGLASDPNGGPKSSNTGLLSVWRSKTITGPYEGPKHVVTSNVLYSCVNTGTVVLGPDNVTWYYLYDAIESNRWNMQRQMFLDKLSWDDSTGWPKPMTPSRSKPFPTTSAGVTWKPELSDDFNTPGLEGVTTGILGRKWLFKQEDPSLWSLSTTPGSLTLSAECTGIDSMYPANMLLQRPTAAYYTLESKLRWVGECSSSTSGRGEGGHGGIIARELNSGSSAAVGLMCKNGTLSVAYWQDTLNLIDSVALPHGVNEVWVRMDVELLLVKPWYSLDGKAWDWVKATGHIHDDPQMAFIYGASYRLGWESTHSKNNSWQYPLSFTTMHPGLFAGGATQAAAAAAAASAASASASASAAMVPASTDAATPTAIEFDWWKYTDNEVWPE